MSESQAVDRKVAEAAVKTLLLYIGEDVGREGLEDTPARVIKALREMTDGYNQCPQEILSRRFKVPYDEMVVVKGIRFFSLCEHHMLPFYGTASVGYIPGGEVVGLSKIPRLVKAFARRLQVQERFTNQIADHMEHHLCAEGVGVLIEAKHMCMGCRGIMQPEAKMVTSAMRGLMMDDAKARTEFLGLVGFSG